MPGLKIFYSDRIEDLAKDLKERLLKERENQDPFTFSQVVVPNTNIAKWLQIRIFAKERNLCAGIKFPFVEQRLTELMLANLPKNPAISLLPDHAYAGAIMAALLSPRDALPKEFDALTPFRAYVSGDDGKNELQINSQRQARMGWQLAVKMADLMDQYEVRRPEIVDRWLKEQVVNAGETPSAIEVAEAALARLLWGENGAFPSGGERLSLRQLFDRVSTTPPSGPKQTIYFFGHSTLSLLQVKILAWLACTHEVVFYHNNVCLEYWGDIETKGERIKRLGKSHADEVDISVENPLLQQWGVAGRETMRLLVQLEEENDGRINFVWKCIADEKEKRLNTVLGRIQESIRHRTSVIDKVPQDASLQVVGVPGIRREVEMVYNAILGAVWKPDNSGERPWPDCSFSDIAVLVPDMANYRPIIEAVFDARGQIPYGLIDTTASEDSQFLAGFLSLADLARKGLTRETLFAVLDNPCVQKALGFSGTDVDGWRELTEKVGAFDGFESREGASRFNWDWALSRLRLAHVADKLSIKGESDTDMPLVGEGGNKALKFSEVVELIYRKVEETFGKPDLPNRRTLSCAIDRSEGDTKWRQNWAFSLTKLMNVFLAVPDENPLEETIQRQIVQTLESLTSLPGSQDCEVALAAVEQFVGGISCRKGGYLTHGVTIAGLQPMRPVPFKQIFVLGLGANGFPGRTSSSTLDIRGTGWRLGDTATPKINRYLFLETVMSARDRLVLSYPNQDIEKNAELFPSGIVRELEEFAGDMINGGPFEVVEKYPLRERGESDAGGTHSSVSDSPSCVRDLKWDPKDRQAGILPTYSTIARKMARERLGIFNGTAVQPIQGNNNSTLDACSTADNDAATKHGSREVSANELAEFLKSPLRAVLRFQFGVGVEGYRDKELEVDSPLGVSSGPVEWELEAKCLEADAAFDKLFKEKQFAGELPMGFLGDFAKETITERISPSLDMLRNFAAAFGVNAGNDHTSRLRVPLTVNDSEGTAVKVQYVAETPNWVESDAGVSVLVTGYLKEKIRPIDRTLAPFMAFLMHLAKDRHSVEKTVLRIGVIDIGNALTSVWHWNVSPDEARNYLQRLTRRYWSFLRSVNSTSEYVDFTYTKLAKAIQTAENNGEMIDGSSEATWDMILKQLTTEEWRGNSKKSSFNNELVVEQTLETYRRDPSKAELKDLYEKYYRLPLSGIKETDVTGGAK